MRYIYLLLGSNIDAEQNIYKAIELIKDVVKIVDISNVWQTPAIGMDAEPFLNVALKVESDKELSELKYDYFRKIEKLLGRVREKNRFVPRTMDIDIVIYDDKVVDSDAWSSAHVAVPLSEIYPLKKQAHQKSLEKILNYTKKNKDFILRDEIKLR